MKKVKFITTICVLALCIFTLTFGAVAALSKTLTVSGSIGFSAKDCDVEVACSITGAVNVVDTASNVTATPNNVSYSYTKVTNQMEGWQTPPSLYFDEYTSRAVPDIVFTFSVKNNSDFSISASATVSSLFTENIGSNLDVDIDNVPSIAKNTVGTLVITLSANEDTNRINIAQNFNLFNLSFTRI